MINILEVYRVVSGIDTKVAGIASDDAILANGIMNKNEVSVTVVTDTIPDIQEGDFIRVDGIKYKINRAPEFADKSSVNHTTTYLFEAPEYTLIDKILTNRITKSVRVTLTGKLRDWLELLIWNVNKTNDNPLGVDTGWELGNIPDTEYMTLSFDGINCRSLLSELASAYDYEYYVHDHTINYVSRIENERNLTFTQGQGGGLYEVEQSNVDSGDVTTRVYPVGGTKNMTPGEGDEEGRLMLPEKYLENFSETNRVVEKKIVFDDIHPSFTGIVNSPTGENYREFICRDIDFNIEELAIGDDARINFLTGDLMGKSFEFKWDNSNKKITLIYQEDELASINPETQSRPLIPSATKYLRGGETFNFTGIRLGESYKQAAISKLREKATDWLAFNSQKRVKFTLDVDYRYMREKGGLECGDLITISMPSRNISRIIRIVSTEKNLKTGKLSCVVSNYLTEKWADKIEGQISSMQATINGGGGNGSVTVLEKYDERPLTDKNVLSSLRTLLEITERALSKEYPDSTNYLIKFLAGLECGNFAQGSTGVGIYKDEFGNWHIETDYLDVRMKFTAKAIEIQKTYHIGGAQVKSAAAMKCVQVEELTDVYRCYMNTTDDNGNEVSNDFRVNDQAYVNTFNLVRQADGKIGNHFFWRLVVSVGSNYIDLSKTVCAVGSDIPKPADDIVLLGYQGTDDPSRQVAVIDAGAGEGAPYYRQFVGINSFHLPAPETQLKPGDNLLSGRLHIEKGSTGWKNMEGLPDEIQAAADLAQKAQDAIDGTAVSSVNLLRNSGFTGNYESEELSAETRLSADAELYSKSLKYWSGMATVQDDSGSVSGKSVIVGSLSQSVSLMNQEVYVISYKAKGTSLAVSCGDYNVARPLTSEYQRYTHKLTFSGAGIFMLSGSATVCDVQLERGTIATDWKPSPLDNDKTMEKFQGIRYITNAIKNGSVDIIGGLILANMVQLGNYKDGKMQKVTAGISGIYNDDDDVADWAGGTFEQAIRTVMMYKNNPRYQPTVAELENMAKAVRTHGGRAILNDVILRGYVYALGGYFHGAIEQADGFNKMNEDGSVSFAGGKIRWGIDGKPVIEGKITTASGGKRIEVSAEENRIIMYNDAEQEVGRIDFMDSEYNGTILSLPRIRLKNVVTSNGVSSDVHSIYINPSSILMDQVFRDGTYSVLLNPSGLEFLKDGVRTRKYSNV
jgi:hypothetical protein|nr:MAG TPA: tail protein [Caudoviricetes sp.]DAZ05529.1 MAG TPA: tail protein [Caudoviricetes sp.]